MQKPSKEESTVEETTEEVVQADSIAEQAPEDLVAEQAAAVALAQLQQSYETKLSESKDQLLRAMAETENVRRRSQRDVEESSKYAITSFARDMITVAENLQMALQSIPETARQEEGLLKTLADGVDMTQRELLKLFEKQNIKRIVPLGEKFDHNFHQAVSQVEDITKESGTVLHVLQAGYTLHDRLLRPAMVVVSKQGDAAQKVDTQA